MKSRVSGVSARRGAVYGFHGCGTVVQGSGTEGTVGGCGRYGGCGTMGTVVIGGVRCKGYGGYGTRGTGGTV